MSISIYRPSSIIRRHSLEQSSSDFSHDIIDYSRHMRAVPDLRNMNGYLNFVPVETVVDAIVQGLLTSRSDCTPGPRYRNLIGNLDLPFNQLRERLSSEIGDDFDILPLVTWTSRARQIGMPSGMAAVFEGLGQSTTLHFPRLETGETAKHLPDDGSSLLQ
jgi:hypothetical protein